MVRRLVVVALLCAAAILTTGAASSGYDASSPTEERFAVTGPWGVSHMTTIETCDREGHVCSLFYPTELGHDLSGSIAGTFRHPVIVWANGTGMQPANYDYLLAHLASWGFVVVAPHDDQTTTGETMVDAFRWLQEDASQPKSVFHTKLDFERAAVAGHSQGGATAMALLIQQAEPFVAYLAIHPAPSFITPYMGGFLVNKFNNDLAQAERGAIMYLQSVGDGGAEDTERYYFHTPNSVTKVFGVLAQAKHDDVMGDPECRNDSTCITGAFGYLGYPTAWFMWHLRHDDAARAAFDRYDGEWLADDEDWNRRRSNVGNIMSARRPAIGPCDGENIVTLDGIVIPWTASDDVYSFSLPTTFTLDLSDSGFEFATVSALLEWTIPTNDYDLFLDGNGPWESSVLLAGSTSESATSGLLRHCDHFDVVIDNFAAANMVETLTLTLTVQGNGTAPGDAAVPDGVTSSPPATPDHEPDDSLPATGAGLAWVALALAPLGALRRRTVTRGRHERPRRARWRAGQFACRPHPRPRRPYGS